MTRETDEDIFKRMKEQKKEVDSLKEEIDKTLEKEETKESDIPDMNKPTEEALKEVMEREINLSLLNDKINFIISLLQKDNTK